MEMEDPLENGLSKLQYVVMIFAGLSSAILSIMGSLVIIYLAWPQFRKSLYQRIVVTLSAADIVFSVSNIVHPYLMPKLSNLPWAFGNWTTCNVAGFFIIFTPQTVAMTTCFLSLYFLLKIRYNVPEKRLNKYQIPALFFIFVPPLVFGIVGVYTDSMNPSPIMQICYFNDFPPNCARDDAVDCIRGDLGDKIGWGNVALLSLSSTCGAVFTLFIWVSYRHQCANASTISRNESRLAQVTSQAMWYFAVFINSFLWPFLVFGINEVIGDVRGRQGEPLLYTFTLLAWTFFPLQGILNCLVYLRPDVVRLRRLEPELGIFDILLRILSKKQLSRRSSLVMQSSVRISRAQLAQNVP